MSWFTCADLKLRMTQGKEFVSVVGEGGGVRLIFGFQPLMVISPTASWIRWCLQVLSVIGTGYTRNTGILCTQTRAMHCILYNIGLYIADMHVPCKKLPGSQKEISHSVA